jgi:hypothetical protein
MTANRGGQLARGRLWQWPLYMHRSESPRRDHEAPLTAAAAQFARHQLGQAGLQSPRHDLRC